VGVFVSGGVTLGQSTGALQHLQTRGLPARVEVRAKQERVRMDVLRLSHASHVALLQDVAVLCFRPDASDSHPHPSNLGSVS
jgi:hypothetical protein